MHVPWNRIDPDTGERLPGDAEWRRVGVYGCGVSGRAAAALLRAHGVEVRLWDGRSADDLDLGPLGDDDAVELSCGGEPGPDAVNGLDAIIASPGVPRDRPLLKAAIERGLPVLAEVELAFPFLDGEVVGITGSNGKSTTTAMTGAILEAAGRSVVVCGNIGKPLAAALLERRGTDAPAPTYVVELSSFQLESVERFHPRAAALLNISPDHLDRHGTLEGYRAAKTRIFFRQREGDVSVLNGDDPLVDSVETAARRRWFSRLGTVTDGCSLEGDRVVEIVPDEVPLPLFDLADLPVSGPHNVENAMAAALLARAVGATPDDVRRGLRGFRGLPHRLERVAESGGVTWFDDSKGTNVGATLRSLEGFPDGSVHLVLGGRNKGADLRQLRPLVARKAARVYLVGESADELAEALGPEHEPEVSAPVERVETIERAVARAAETARSGEHVVLSPACASFDQFESFVHRGREFQRLVHETLATAHFDTVHPGTASGGGDG